MDLSLASLPLTAPQSHRTPRIQQQEWKKTWPYLSHVSPAHDFQRKRTFADLRPSSTVIDISDSPIRSSSSVNPVPSIKKVKQELPEDPEEASDLEHALEAVMAEELGDVHADEVSADEEAAREMHEDE